ncbi:MAG: TraB/GumN family protein [Treponema sp.]|nr:TraB/GumN family protein [Treponema sp.]
MKQTPILFPVLALAVFTLASCASRPAPPPPRPEIHGFISRVEYGQNVAYVFGSMHLGRPEWFPLSPIVEDAIARADVFAFEVDMELMASPAVMAHAANLMMLPDGLTLRDVLPPESFQGFLESLEVLPTITYEMIANFTPVGASMIIATVEMLPLMGIYSIYSVDSYVHAIAMAAGKPVIGLNDIFHEVDLLFGVPMEIQTTMFDNPADWEDVDWTVADWDTIVQYVVDMGLVEAYKAGDAAMLRDALGSALSENPTPFEEHFHHTNFHVRCHIFADEIARLLRETGEPTTFFVTVGAAHIIGGNFGKVLTLLEDMGFNVEPRWK